MVMKPQKQTNKPKTPHDPGRIRPRVRQCLITRERLDEAQLLRFALSPEHVVTPDYNRKLPGRGVWVGLAQLDKLTVGHFRRGFKDNAATLSNNWQESLIGQIDRQISGTLSLLNRKGDIIRGFEAVMSHLRDGRPTGAYVTSADNTSDSRQKIIARLDDVPVFSMTEKNGLDQALGQENMTHVIVKPGDLCLNLVQHFENRARIAPNE